MLQHGASFKFYAYKKKKKTIGSVCVDNGWLVNDAKNVSREFSSLPIPSSSIYVPFCRETEHRVILPFRSKCLHPLQHKQFINTSYNVLSKRKAAFTKNIDTDFSKKTISTREREIRNFLSSGGDFVSVEQLDGKQLFTIYSELYQARRNVQVKDQDLNLAFFQAFHHHFKGHVMFRNNEPVAIQLLLSVASKAGLFVDFINIGYRMDMNAGALGTMLMWKNLTSLHQEAGDKNYDLHYSYGFMSGAYKNRWCKPVSLGRVVI